MTQAGGGRPRGARSRGTWLLAVLLVLAAPGRPAAETGLATGADQAAAIGSALEPNPTVSADQISETEAASGPAGLRVVLVDVETGAELWWAPAEAGHAVGYAYVHSADKTPVESVMRVEPPPVGLVLEAERYLWYGAGLEYRRDRGVVLDGQWVVVRAERVIGRLLLRVAGTVEQTVTVGEQTVRLGELAEYGRRVALEVRP